LSFETSLSQASTGLGCSGVEVDSIVVAGCGTCTENSIVVELSIGSACACSSKRVDYGVDGRATSGQTVANRTSSCGGSGGGASESIGSSAGPEVEIGRNTNGLMVSHVPLS